MGAVDGDLVIPFQTSHGMKIVASFTDDENPDQYVWIRGFEDEAQRDRQIDAAYNSDTWKNEILPQLLDVLLPEKAVVTQVRPTTITEDFTFVGPFATVHGPDEFLQGHRGPAENCPRPPRPAPRDRG